MWSRPLLPGIVGGPIGVFLPVSSWFPSFCGLLCNRGVPLAQVSWVSINLLISMGLFCQLIFGGWPASGGVVVVSGGPKPPLRELSPVLPRHVRPCWELRIWAALPGGVTVPLLCKVFFEDFTNWARLSIFLLVECNLMFLRKISLCFFQGTGQDKTGKAPVENAGEGRFKSCKRTN